MGSLGTRGGACPRRCLRPSPLAPPPPPSPKPGGAISSQEHATQIWACSPPTLHLPSPCSPWPRGGEARTDLQGRSPGRRRAAGPLRRQLIFLTINQMATEDGRKSTPLLCLTLGMASLGVSWVGHLRGCNSHGGSASGRASEACGCPFAGRDRHGDPLHTDQCFWRLLLALCAIATPEAVLGEWVAMLLRQWIEPLRKLHR